MRSLEEEAIMVEQILPLDRLHDGWEDIEDIEDFHCQNVFKINEDTFYQLELDIVKIDVEDNIQRIALQSESSSDSITSRFCVPLHYRGAFLVILKLFRNQSTELEARKFSLEDGYVTISQPEDKPYCVSEQLHLLTDQDAGKVYVIGKLAESGNSQYGINIYTIDTDTWTFNYLESVSALDDKKLYTSSFPIYT